MISQIQENYPIDPLIMWFFTFSALPMATRPHAIRAFRAAVPPAALPWLMGCFWAPMTCAAHGGLPELKWRWFNEENMLILIGHVKNWNFYAVQYVWYESLLNKKDATMLYTTCTQHRRWVELRENQHRKAWFVTIKPRGYLVNLPIVQCWDMMV